MGTLVADSGEAGSYQNTKPSFMEHWSYMFTIVNKNTYSIRYLVKPMHHTRQKNIPPQSNVFDIKITTPLIDEVAGNEIVFIMPRQTQQLVSIHHPPSKLPCLIAKSTKLSYVSFEGEKTKMLLLKISGHLTSGAAENSSRSKKWLYSEKEESIVYSLEGRIKRRVLLINGGMGDGFLRPREDLRISRSLTYDI
uniref:Major sperm protein n=1 Tax=Romanomermis culicivorax TaxID=13658 RepID=A0A915J8T5_ROMCU